MCEWNETEGPQNKSDNYQYGKVENGTVCQTTYPIDFVKFLVIDIGILAPTMENCAHSDVAECYQLNQLRIHHRIMVFLRLLAQRCQLK